MKHRSTGIFIIILAALIAAPSASQQLVALKDAAAGRLEATLWDAFLSLNGRHAESAAGASAPIQQVGPSEAEIAARDKKTTEAMPKTREASRPEPRRASGREEADARETELFVAKFENAESLFAFDADSESAVRFAVPANLPFDLDELLKSAHKGTRPDVLAARVRAVEAGARKIKIYPAPPVAALKREQAAKVAPRARAARDAAKRLPAAGFQRNEWERPNVNIDSDDTEAERAAPRHHAGESNSRR
ncbi:MAG TPA: hypothetical protein VFX96_09090 [Pyrinomonadaceae bacterium]|nr:hypothetical protein [Pyrinomonadaceae bacterium]